MRRLITTVLMMGFTGCATVSAGATVNELVISTEFSAEQVEVIEAAAEAWNVAAPGVNIITRVGEPANVTVVRGPGEAGEDCGGCTVVGKANRAGIRIWVDAIGSAEVFSGTVTHEISHWLGVHYHDESGACTNAFVTECVDINEHDIFHVNKAQGLLHND